MGRDLDHVWVGLCLFIGKSLSVGVLDKTRDVVGLRCVEDVEEELAVRLVGLGPLFGKELCQLRLLHHIGDEVDDAELVVSWNLDRPQLSQRD